MADPLLTRYSVMVILDQPGYVRQDIMSILKALVSGNSHHQPIIFGREVS